MKRSTRIKALLPSTFALLMAASREAELAGRTTVGLDDLLVALLATGGPASRVLAAHGANLVALRTAVVERDRDDLAHLGIDGTGLTPPRRTLAEAFAVQRGLDVSPAVEDVLTRLPSEKELLTALLTHSSGGPAEALARAGVEVAAVLAHQPWLTVPKPGRAEPVPGLLDGQEESTTRQVRFVPVPFERIVEVVSQPRAVAAWYLVGQQVEVAQDGASLTACLGSGARSIVTEYRRVRCDVGAGRADVIWQAFWVQPAADDPRGHYIRIQAEREGSGTQLTITRGANGRGRLARPARWLAGVFGRMSGSNLVHGLAEVAVSPQ